MRGVEHGDWALHALSGKHRGEVGAAHGTGRVVRLGPRDALPVKLVLHKNNIPVINTQRE